MKHVDPMFRNPLRPVARHGANVVFDSSNFRSSAEGFESSRRRFLRTAKTKNNQHAIITLAASKTPPPPSIEASCSIRISSSAGS
jgi:hypothetical protein